VDYQESINKLTQAAALSDDAFNKANLIEDRVAAQLVRQLAESVTQLSFVLLAIVKEK
jgi:hypothetical protein